MEPSSSLASSEQVQLADYCINKEQQGDLLRQILPQCQPQEGSPANTFTSSEIGEMQKVFPNLKIGPQFKKQFEPSDKSNNLQIDIRDLDQWQAPSQDAAFVAPPQDGMDDSAGLPELAVPGPSICAPPQDGTESASQGDRLASPEVTALDWHGAPRFSSQVHMPRAFREEVRAGRFTTPTNGVCPGFLQCNLVVLPQGKVAFDFLLFCQRNPKACPLIEVCDAGSPHPTGVAPGADLRTDVPKYAIYRDGKLEKEVTDVTDYWPEESVAFLIGCSFSYDGALLDAGIRLKSAEQGKNVPMYNTSLKCRPAGSLRGNMVVSMKPIPALSISKHIEITSKYTHAHGGPVCVGSASAIGIKDIDRPEWGDAVEVEPHEVPIFHACGVTPQSILMESKVPFAITHSAGHMFVTDLPSDMGV